MDKSKNIETLAIHGGQYTDPQRERLCLLFNRPQPMFKNTQENIRVLNTVEAKIQHVLLWKDPFLP